MPAKPCRECGTRPKALPAQRCLTCALRHKPVGEQVEAARARLAMVPEPLRVKRTKAILALAPAGTSWCAACQSFRDVVDFGKGATTCRACVSGKSHAAMVAKTYGIDAARYDELMKLQGGRCAICGARPKSKRLSVDHRHGESGEGSVRGLLCKRCNHDALGALHDSLAMATAAWHYLNTPPASGAWTPLASQSQLEPVGVPATRDDFATLSASPLPVNDDAPTTCTRTHYVPSGAVGDPAGDGYWRVYVRQGAENPPF